MKRILVVALACVTVLCAEGAKKKAIGCGWGFNNVTVDDFLANGSALRALKELCAEAGANVAGAGIAIEKKYQGGGDELRAEGLRVESMARIASMDAEDGIRFC